MSDMCSAKPDKNHEWLKKFVGQWEMESECVMGPDQPPMKGTAKETVRMVGDLWMVGESTMSMPGAGEGQAILTLGYDPNKKKFVGSWIGSMMTHLFVYEGDLDEATGTLPLHCTGPDFADPTKLGNYKDVYRLSPSGERSLTSFMQTPDGKWVQFMTAKYKRVR